MKLMTLAQVREHTGQDLSHEAAAKIVGASVREPFLSNMILALNLMTWRNSAEDWLRLQASMVVKANKRREARAAKKVAAE